mgnify:CR=1 FL=1
MVAVYSTVAINSTEFGKCGSSTFGGGLTSLYATIELTDARFDHCEAGHIGGGIFKSFSSLELTSVIFVNNTAEAMWAASGGITGENDIYMSESETDADYPLVCSAACAEPRLPPSRSSCVSWAA